MSLHQQSPNKFIINSFISLEHSHGIFILNLANNSIKWMNFIQTAGYVISIIHLICTPGRARTYDLSFRKALLYPTELQAQASLMLSPSVNEGRDLSHHYSVLSSFDSVFAKVITCGGLDSSLPSACSSHRTFSQPPLRSPPLLPHVSQI